MNEFKKNDISNWPLKHLDLLLVRAECVSQRNAVAIKLGIIFSLLLFLCYLLWADLVSDWLMTSKASLLIDYCELTEILVWASQAGTQCGQLYTNVCIHSHQNWHVKGLLSEKVRMPSSQWMSDKLSTALLQVAQANGGPHCWGGNVTTWPSSW